MVAFFVLFLKRSPHPKRQFPGETVAKPIPMGTGHDQELEFFINQG
jgi:hypothetical protein